MTQKSEQQDPSQLKNIEETLNKAELYVEKNKKILIYIFAGILVVIGSLYAYKYLYLEPKQEEGLSAIWQAENYFKQDSFKLALSGNAAFDGFETIAEDYSGTKIGNIANYYAGISSLHIGKYEDAISYLEEFDAKDEILEARAIGAKGDAYSELKQYEKAIELYNDAATLSNHHLTTPYFLMKIGLVYEKLGKKDKALEVYKTIKDKYDTSNEAYAIDKYIIRASN